MVLTLHCPDQAAVIESGMYAAGVEALNAAGDNPDVRSVVIVGEGDTFCADANLQRFQAWRGQGRELASETLDTLNLWIDTISTFPKPVLAAVEGSAAGTAFSIALACDLVVASREAFFALSHGRAGLPPDGGSTWHLARALPRNMALEIALLGERLSAERLHALGLVNRLAAPGQALQDALALADRLNQRAPNVIAATKELLAAAPASTLGRHLVAERDAFVEQLQHANADAGMAALLARRSPVFD
jgi:enoyl-CoA hydratase/carnithine racemase